MRIALGVSPMSCVTHVRRGGICVYVVYKLDASAALLLEMPNNKVLIAGGWNKSIAQYFAITFKCDGVTLKGSFEWGSGFLCDDK